MSTRTGQMRECWEQQEPISPRGKWLIAACWFCLDSNLLSPTSTSKNEGGFHPNTIGFLSLKYELLRKNRAFAKKKTNIYIFVFTVGGVKQTLSAYFFWGFNSKDSNQQTLQNTKRKFAKSTSFAESRILMLLSLSLSIGEWLLVGSMQILRNLTTFSLFANNFDARALKLHGCLH